MSSELQDFAARWQSVLTSVAQAARRAGRDASQVQVVAVAKTHPPEVIRLALAAGVRVFGENYVQELRAKQQALADDPAPAPRWHFIGSLQKNKAKDIVGRVALIHSVDSEGLAAVLARRAEAAAVVQDVLLQVNLVGEASKGGVGPGDLPALLRLVRGASSLRCRGLMLIPPLVAAPEDNRPLFRDLAQLAREHELPELSMGMSADYQVAVEEGATLVRVGTAIFGARQRQA